MQRLNQIFDTVRYAHWSWGEEGMILYRAGPYRVGDYYMSFSLDDSREYVVSAEVSAEAGFYTFGQNTPEPIHEFSSGINLLSAAAATSAVIFAEEYEYITPEEFAEIPDAYWQTVANALTMYKMNNEGDFDPYSGELMRMPAWLTDACRLAFFPGTEEASLYTQGGSVYRDANEYLMDSCSYGDFASWEHISSESGVDGKTGSVVIEVTCPEIMPYPVRYRVEWAANDTIDIYMPFNIT